MPVVNIVNIFGTQHIRQMKTSEIKKNTEKWGCTYFDRRKKHRKQFKYSSSGKGSGLAHSIKKSKFCCVHPNSGLLTQ